MSAANPPPADQQTPVRAPSGPLRVLLVDDCPFQQMLSCVMLSRWGIVPEIARDGLEAVRLAGERDFDLIPMDIEMPVMDGLKATAAIRRQERTARRRRKVPVVAYSASDLTGHEGEWQGSGINAILQKPCDALAMQDCLRQWCPKAKLVTQRH